MEPALEPTVSAYSPLFELRAWRRELDRLSQQCVDDKTAIEAITRAKHEADEWIRARERRKPAGS